MNLVGTRVAFETSFNKCGETLTVSLWPVYDPLPTNTKLAHLG